MTPNESIRYENALRNHFTDYQIKIVKTILSAEGNLDQEDIIRTSEESIHILRKLGWYKRFKTVIRDSAVLLKSLIIASSLGLLFSTMIAA